MKAKQVFILFNLKCSIQILFSLSKISSILGSIYLVSKHGRVCTGMMMPLPAGGLFHEFEQELEENKNKVSQCLSTPNCRE